MPALLIPVLAILLAAPTAGNPDHPGAGVHLSLGTRPGDVVVSWSTPLLNTTATLRWGPRPSELVSSAVPVNTTLSNNEPILGPGKAGPWRNTSCHHATMTGVQVSWTTRALIHERVPLLACRPAQGNLIVNVNVSTSTQRASPPLRLPPSSGITARRNRVLQRRRWQGA